MNENEWESTYRELFKEIKWAKDAAHRLGLDDEIILDAVLGSATRIAGEHGLTL